MSEFLVDQPVFHGPLDLLLHLVRNEEIDVLEVALAEVADRYIEHIELLTRIDIEDVGEFLVVASALMEIKSRRLIPRRDEAEEVGQEETRHELVKQLLEYKRFKEAGNLLLERAAAQRQKLRRIADDLPVVPTDPANQPLREIELWDLVSAFGRLLKENVVPIDEGIPKDPTPITVYMDRLEKMVLATEGILLAELIGQRNTRPQIIGKFLALLELIKSRRVWVEVIDDAEEVLVCPPRANPPVAPVDSPDAEHESDELRVPPDSAALAQGAAAESHEVADGERPSDAGATERSREEATPDPWGGDSSDVGAESRSSAWDDFEPIGAETDAAGAENLDSPENEGLSRRETPDPPDEKNSYGAEASDDGS